MPQTGSGEGFKMGIGLNTGDVMSGNVGSARRLECTGRKGAMKVWALRSSATVREEVNAAARQPAP
jgi:hypothetical protein